jgi:diguanylate cyclase (GGDEF)-like protein/PAS domain S-box-containing protein
MMLPIGKLKVFTLLSTILSFFSSRAWASTVEETLLNTPLFLLTTIALLLTLLLYWHKRLRRVKKNRAETNHVAQSYLKIINQYVITSKTDLDGNILDVSDAFCQISGFSKEELVGKSHGMIRHPDTSGDTYQCLWDAIANDQDWQGEMCNQKKDGTTYWVHASITANYDMYGRKIGYIAVHQDITDHKLVIELSIRDALTGLYNRRHFNDYFEKHLKDSHECKKPLSLMIFDIDNFKKYNDTYGHQKGDEVLRDTSAVLQYCVDGISASCFRLGGEEFAIIAVMDESQANALAEHVRSEVEALTIEHIDNAHFGVVTTSVGVYTYLADDFSTPEPDELFRIADQSLYRAKEMGRNQVCSSAITESSIELF